MNNAVHQLTKLILEAMAWVLDTAGIAVGLVVDADRGAVRHGVGDLRLKTPSASPSSPCWPPFSSSWRYALDALGRIAAAFWTMALTLFTLLAFVIAAGLFSRHESSGWSPACRTSSVALVTRRVLRHARRA